MPTTYPDFSTLLAPTLSELQTRLAALEAALFVTKDSPFTTWNSSIDLSGNNQLEVDLAPETYFTITLASTSAAPLTSGALTVLGSVSLPAGFRYEELGQVNFTATGAGSPAQSVTAFVAAISTSNSALPTDKNQYRTSPGGGTTLPVDSSQPLPPLVLDLTGATGATTVYLLTKATFSGGAAGTGVSAYGVATFKQRP